jgi:uncharacterized protein (DUF2236 family)
METLFGPASAVWVLHGDVAGLVGGVRALAVQALEPRALAGVNQFSAFVDEPDRRLAETIEFMDVVTYAPIDEVEAAVAAVRRLHEPVRGVDPVSHLPFFANDPELLAWVHDALVVSVARAYAELHPGCARELLDDYVDEMRRFAGLMGADMGLVPRTYAATARLVETWPTLVVSGDYRRALEVLDGLRLVGPIGAVWGSVLHWVRQSLPGWVRAELDVRPDPAGDLLAWVLIRLVGEVGRILVPPSPRKLAALGAVR